VGLPKQILGLRVIRVCVFVILKFFFMVKNLVVQAHFMKLFIAQ
jgi:hypothetical protein